jgi:LysR family transcriptional regulator (chromosome initiation inhibitor)
MGTLDYRALAVLDAVVSQGSFEKAALALGISQSAVSQRIKALEDTAGRLLIIRGQPAVPTGLGMRLVSHHRSVRLMEAALDIDLGHSTSMPEIALAVDSASLSTWFPPPAAAAGAAPLPAQDPQRCARTGAAAGAQGGVFGAIIPASHGALPASGADITPLGKLRYVCVATPAFAAHWFGDGYSIEAARLAPAIVSDAELMAGYLHQTLGLQGSYPHHSMPPSAASANACMAAWATA